MMMNGDGEVERTDAYQAGAEMEAHGARTAKDRDVDASASVMAGGPSRPAPASPVDVTSANIPITGMTCSSCASTIERALLATEGVSVANVNFGTERALVRYDPSRVSRSLLEAAIEGAGYGVARDDLSAPEGAGGVLHMRVAGMVDDRSVKAVELAVQALGGIVSADMHPDGSGVVHYDDRTVTSRRIMDAIWDAGFQPVLVGEGAATRDGRGGSTSPT